MSTNLSEIERTLLAKRLQRARAKKTKPQTIARRPAGEPAQLSFAQRRLWFLCQWMPDTPAYNIPFAFRIAGQLDVVALRRAFNELLRRHQVLHVIYTTVDEEPVQIPHPEPRLALEIVDVSALPAGEREAEGQRLAVRQANRPFDLARDLLVRATLVRLDQAEHLLLLTIHHIAMDGWSASVLFGEIQSLYEAYRAGRLFPLPELPIQYADFAHWQRHWLRGEVLDRQLAYWKRQLANAPAVLELPADRPRPPVQTFNGASLRFRLAPALNQAIRTLSQQEGVTPFMTLLAAFQALLYRYTGQSDVVVGSPIAGRNRSEIEGLIGFFVNTLALRTDLSGNPSGRELLQRVREVTLEAYAHQDIPFEKLVEELQPERSLSHSPLFQVMLNYHNTPPSTLELPDLTIQDLQVYHSAAKFDLNVALGEDGEGLRGTVVYNADLFDPSTISRMVEHYRVLLAGLVAQPEASLAELPLLTPAERRQLLVEWTQTRTAYPPVVGVHHMFEEQVTRTPEAVAVVFKDQPCTYRELNERANRMAHHLQSLGVGPEVRVGLFMERSLEVLVALLGILKAGGAYVPLDPVYPPERVRFMLQDVQVPVLLTQARLADELGDLGGVRVICLDRDRDTIAEHSAENLCLPIAPSNLMYVLFTSGSTGRPKGVAVEHRNYLNYFHGVLRKLELSPGMSFVLVTTFATDLGTTMFWGALCTGGRVHIVSYQQATDPEALAGYFGRHPVDVLKLVPSHFEALQGASHPIVPRQLLILTGEASYWETVVKVKALNPGCVVQDHYGVTETTCATLIFVAPDELPTDGAATLPKGWPLGNTHIYILDDVLQPVPVGVPGELYIGGAGVTRGYLGRPALTAGRFVPDPFPPQGKEFSQKMLQAPSPGRFLGFNAPEPPPSHRCAQGCKQRRGPGAFAETLRESSENRAKGARLYRTGDLARYRSDGTIQLLGRMDHQVKLRGHRIEIGEIESLLSEHATLQDAVVVTRETTPAERQLVAYVVPRPAQEGRFSTSALREYLRAKLPDYMLPGAFVTLERIPLNPNGKVDRFALPAPDPTRPDVGQDFVAPRNELEAQIADSWSQVLDVAKIGIDDDFFDLGGQSFKAIRVARKIGPPVSVMDLFKHPTVRRLAAHLSQGQPRSEGLLHRLTPPVPAGENVLSLVCIPFGGGNAVVYQPLADALPKNYSLYAVQIPGHDYSRRDEALRPLQEVARQCVAEIQREVTGPVALYGHCVGGALALEIARLLQENDVEVAGLFMGGAFPSPRLPGKLFEWLARIFHSDRWRPNRTLYESLRALGGFTDLVDPEEQAFMLQSLRHDAREAEDYYTQAYAAQEGAKLAAPILCLVGQGDRATELYQERFKEWTFFSDAIDLAVIPQAGHYFLKHQADQVARIIANQLAVWQNGRRAPAKAAPTRLGLSTFFLVALGQFISLIGTGLTSFALGVWVYQQTGSVSAFAFISVFALLPGILLLPIAGAIVDRWDRRLIMLLSDVVAACATLLVALLFWADALQIWHIYVVAGVGAIANAFQGPAYTASIAQLVPKRYLGHANGIVQLGSATGGLLAPLLGGVLVVAIGLHGVVLIDVATFLFAVTTLLLVRFPDTLFQKQEEPMLQAVVGGWRYIKKRSGLVAMIAFFTVVNFVFSLVRVLVTPLALSFTSPATLGAALAAGGAGTLLGSLVMSLWGGTKRRAEGMVGAVALGGLSAIVMGLRPSPIYLALGLFGNEISRVLTNTHWQTLIQTKVGLELQGRVLSTNVMLGLSMQPLGFVLAGPLVSRVFEPLMANSGPLANSVGPLMGSGPGRGMGLMMVAVGVIAIGWTVLGFRYRPLRFMEDSLPDAIPDPVIVADKDVLQAQADRQLMAEAV